ncbi:hypothetical protein F4802DRAFT_586378 [Xylaria palmicola]|nr:hypothetical protein F4802DRAFT_586378 [Xylaria palmicola]
MTWRTPSTSYAVGGIVAQEYLCLVRSQPDAREQDLPFDRPKAVLRCCRINFMCATGDSTISGPNVRLHAEMLADVGGGNLGRRSGHTVKRRTACVHVLLTKNVSSFFTSRLISGGQLSDAAQHCQNMTTGCTTRHSPPPSQTRASTRATPPTSGLNRRTTRIRSRRELQVCSLVLSFSLQSKWLCTEGVVSSFRHVVITTGTDRDKTRVGELGLALPIPLLIW